MKTIAGLALVLMLALTGCSTPEERAERRAERETAREQADINTCKSYGFQFGTDAFAACRMQVETNRQAAQAAAMDNLINTMGATSQMLQSTVPHPAPPPPQITCYTYGNMTHCQ